jgi:hypothetical protein
MNEQRIAGLGRDRANPTVPRHETRIHRAVVKRRTPSKRRHDPRRLTLQDRCQ